MIGLLMWWGVCRCQHVRADHEHYRTGTACGLCSCFRFRRWWVPRPSFRVWRR